MKVRWLFNAASLISLLLFVAVAAVWPETQRVGRTLTYDTGSGTSCSAGTAPGCCELYLVRGWPPLAPEYEYVKLSQDRGWSYTSAHWGTSVEVELPSSPYMVHSSKEGIQDIVRVTEEINWPPPAHRFLGIGWGSRTDSLTPPIYTRPAIATSSDLTVSFWLLLPLLAVLPAAWLARRVRTHRRRKNGECLSCGYDLRASTQRCPECGTPIASGDRSETSASFEQES